MKGLIIENKADLYRVKINTKVYEARARGKFKKEGISPVVGDNVIITVTDEEKNIAIIDEIIERRVYIKRPHYENHSGLLTTIQRRNIQINKITQNTLLQGENDFAG